MTKTLRELLERSGSLDSEESGTPEIQVKTPWCIVCGESMARYDDMHIFYDYFRRAHIYCWGVGRKDQ